MFNMDTDLRNTLNKFSLFFLVKWSIYKLISIRHRLWDTLRPKHSVYKCINYTHDHLPLHRMYTFTCTSQILSIHINKVVDYVNIYIKTLHPT